MLIQSQGPGEIPRRQVPGRERPPVPREEAHDAHHRQEDFYRSASRLASTLLARNGRVLAHVADAGGALPISNQLFQGAVGGLSLAVGVVDGYQAREAFRAGDRTMGTLNAIGASMNGVGGVLGLAQLGTSSQMVSDLGNLAQGIGILADAAEDLVEARRMQDHKLIARGAIKSAGASLLIAGTLAHNPGLQLIGNVACLGGLALHYVPAGGP